MNIESLQEYIANTTIGKKEYLFIKSFCHDNNIEIIDFFKKGEGYDRYAINNMFTQAFSKSIKDEEMLKYFIEKQKILPDINFKSILDSYDMLVPYQHLFGFSKDEELTLLIKERQYGKILNFLKENPEFKENDKIKTLIVPEFSMIEKFEKAKIQIDKSSYEKIDIEYNNVLGYKEHNQNFIKVDKFYDFLEKNKDKISANKRKDCLKAIMNYGSLTVYDFKKQGYWDYVFIPLIHSKEFPELLEDKNFFPDLIKYKESIFSKKIPYGTLSIINHLNEEEKINLVMNYVKNYKVKKYDYTAIALFNHFINEVNEDFINDFFKEGIEAGYIFKYSLKEEYTPKYQREDEYKQINTSSKSMENEVVKKNRYIIAKQILRHREMFQNSPLSNFIPVGKELIEEKEFILSLNKEDFSSLEEELKNKNLPNTAKKLFEMRLQDKLDIKGIKEKKMKI